MVDGARFGFFIMRSSWLLIFVVLQPQMLTRVWGQPSIGCFVEGKCTQSLYLEEHSTPGGELECLEYCTTVEGSNYFSYDPDTTYCVCWQNCEALSVPRCRNCISGDVCCFPEECFVTNARVNGVLISVDAATDLTECAEKCSALKICNWFTFNREDQACALTRDRESVSDCSSCVYGHADCIQEESSGFTSLFICGGYSATSTGALVDATVMDMPSLDGSPPARNCLQVPDMPGAKNAHFSMWDGDDRSVLACGGESPEFPQGKKCYKYLGDKWVDLGDILLHERIRSSAVQLSDGRYWISGGVNDDSARTSEYYQGGEFLEGPSLPYPLSRHCAVEVEPGFVFIAGNGYPDQSQNKALRFNPENGAFESLPDMMRMRLDLSCSVVRKDSSYDIVVVGGRYSDSSEIYNTETGVWRDGPPLPEGSSHMSSVQYEDTFLLVGGQNHDYEQFDTIYQYDPNLETWILRPERLTTPTRDLGTVLAVRPVAACSKCNHGVNDMRAKGKK